MNEGAPLDSFADGMRVCVFGASGGVGGAMVSALATHPRVARVYAGSRRPMVPPPGAVTPFRFDLEDEASIAAACTQIAGEGPLHLVVVATGLLHDGAGLTPEKTWRALAPDTLARAFAINATGPALIAKHLLGHLATGDKAVFAALSARVGSISDNRLGGWHGYRASKAALHMMIRNFAIELARSNASARVVALHPGTVDTRLSRPFQRGVAQGRLFSPAESAGHLLRVIDDLAPQHSGLLLAWDGEDIPF